MLGLCLSGAAQKQKDTSGSNNEWFTFFFFRGSGGEEHRAPSHLAPAAGITHVHMQSGVGTDLRQQPAAPRDALGNLKK